MEQALSWAGVSAYEEICIRRINIPVRLRLSKSDSALVLTWSVVLAEAIKQTAERRDNVDVVRYGSRVQALIDLAVSIVRSDYRRTWAWRQLDLWREDEQPSRSIAVRALLQALTREAHLLLPVLRTLADLDQFKILAEQFVPEQWVILAAAALSATEASTDLIEIKEDKLPAPVTADIRQRAHRLLASSPLTRALARLTITATEARRAAAILIVLEAEPNALRVSETASRTLISTVSEALAIVTAIAAIEAQSKESPPLMQREERGDVRIVTEQNLSLLGADHLLRGEEQETRTLSDSFLAPFVRRQAPTRFGGLLFLLGIAEDLELPAEMLTQPDLAHRRTGWVLYQLALVLVPAEANDPAVLAFAGLLPETKPLSLSEEPATDAEMTVIASYAARIREAVHERLGRRDPYEALQFVCQRQAVIIADPGWIEVRFALTDVSVEIRRAALDLNPDYLPWLGIVVKFVYE